MASAVSFELSGGREMVNGARATALLVGAPRAPSLLRLSNKSFSLEAAHIIAAYIRSTDRAALRVLDMSDIIAGRPEEEALSVMLAICESVNPAPLIELNVSDNAIGFKGVQSIRSLLTGKQLQRLFLCNNGMSAEAVRLIVDQLFQGGCPTLHLLHFYNNMAGVDGASGIASIVKVCPTLTDFRFSATRATAAGCLAISTALQSLSGLVKLDLADNAFGKAAAAQLATALAGNKGITHLNLRDCGLKAEGVSAVLAALQATRHPLLALDLSGNDITPQVVQAALLPALTQLPLLADLHLDDNELESSGVRLIAAGIAKGSLASLQTLSLCTTELTASGALAIAKVLAKCPHFRRLKADGNAICERGLDAVKSALMRTGKVLEDMDDNDDDGEDDLDEDDDGGDDDGRDDDGGIDDGLSSVFEGVSLSPKKHP